MVLSLIKVSQDEQTKFASQFKVAFSLLKMHFLLSADEKGAPSSQIK